MFTLVHTSAAAGACNSSDECERKTGKTGQVHQLSMGTVGLMGNVQLSPQLGGSHSINMHPYDTLCSDRRGSRKSADIPTVVTS